MKLSKILAPLLALCLFASTACASTFIDAHGNEIQLDDSLEAYAAVTLVGANDAARQGETNLGDLWTDALRWFAVSGEINAAFDEDDVKAGNDHIAVDADHVVALWNGGNLRADIAEGTFGAEALAAAQNISDAAVSEYYEKNAAQFATPEMVRARHILILSDAKASAEDQAKAKAKIEEIAQRIKAGEDFGTVAKEVSEDPGSAPQGGELGWFAHGQMVPEFDKASFALNPGELSEPVKTQFGWHLIQLEEKKAAGQKPLDEVKDQIRTRLAQDEASGKVQEALEQVQLAVIGGKSLKEAGEPLKLAPQETGLVNTTELTEKMGIKPENLPALLAAKTGTVLDTPFVTKTGYVIAKVNESKPQTVKPLDAVKDDIKARLQQDKARTLAFEAANAERKTFTADLPKELQGKLKKTEPVGRQGYMGELGMNAELAKAAFAAKVNEWFPVAYTLDGGAVIARVAEVVTPSDEDWKTAAPQITDAVLNAKREQMFRGFLSLLRSNAKIELKNETILAD